jgi:NADH-quinone oxidoreductase subunit L
VSNGSLLLVIWLLPLAVALLLLFAPWSRGMLAHRVAALLMAVDTGFAALLAKGVISTGETVTGPHATWLDAGTFSLGVGVYADAMGAVMALIVCFLGTFVLIFNAWYMHADKLAARFPWQFCFFLFAMLGVVLSDNLFLSFICWELVGLGSYLLIGFWYDKPAASDDPDYQRMKGAGARGVIESLLSPAHAQLKAFVMNRVGDAAFLIGIGALLMLHAGDSGADALGFGTFANVFRGAPTASLLGFSGQALVVVAALGIFGGAIGKSAQFPLHGWLPDAMQGPTTASSIIHAATMVAAGVFLVARCYPLFPQEALDVVGWTGGITCLLAASIACVQWDLKAVLAYSTVSQLGLMFVGLGAGAAAGGLHAGIAHLFTHALFKCLLFLCAGAVIHACAGNQDLQRMGGLRKQMPVTAYASLAAVLAISGVPGFSGFVSKDAVFAAALARADGALIHAQSASYGPLVLAALGSFLTAAYMLRWWLRIFAGAPRDHDVVHHAHDPAGSAKWVLILLAPFTLMWLWTWGGWLETALPVPEGEGIHLAHDTGMKIAGLAMILGAAFALDTFWLRPHRAAAFARALAPLHRACSELWGIDKLWNLVFARGLGLGLGAFAARIDLGSRARLASLEAAAPAPLADALSLDGAIDGIGRACGRLGRAGASVHAGRLGVYIAVAAVVGAGLLLLGILR